MPCASQHPDKLTRMNAARIVIPVLGLLASVAWATKPTVSIREMVARSDVVLTVEVLSLEVIQPIRKDEQGNWLQEQFRVEARVLESLRGDVRGIIHFETSALRFEPGKQYAVFLRRDGSKLSHLGNPAKRVEATPEHLAEVRSLL